MASTASIKVIKQFTWRGQTRVWSNRYHFDRAAPATSALWQGLSDNVVGSEKSIFQSSMTIIGTVGYAAGSEIPVYQKTYTTAGTGSFAGAQMAPGEAAALVRYSTAARTSKNHPVYLYNYYHGAMSSAASQPDTLVPTQSAAILAYASSWLSGFSDGTNSYKRAGPNGAAATGVLVEPYITHRDFR